jgi:hypothetical protein
MEGNLRAVFTDRGKVEDAIGALRADGVDPKRITVTSRNGEVIGAVLHESHGIGGWFAQHLRHHDPAQEQAQPAPNVDAADGWLVTVTVRSAEEDRSARNLLVTAGAEEISSLDGDKMVRLAPPEVPVAGR